MVKLTLHIYTFKHGLLSRLGHDLRFTASRLQGRLEGRELCVTVDVEGLALDGVLRDGRLHPNELSAGDRDKVLKKLRDEVLKTKRYKEARLVARVSGDAPPLTVEGHLTLCGQTNRLSLSVSEVGERLEGAVEIVPSTYGIAPYSALAGALQVQDRVRLEASVARAALTSLGAQQPLELGA